MMSSLQTSDVKDKTIDYLFLMSRKEMDDKAIDVENRNSDINLVTLDYTFNEEYKHYFKSIDYAKILIELENLCTYLNTL